ncbi:hypothetical protein [Parafrankia sp. EUN1f]|uniref:hypothetical protein n=1 Tax=Parafrankia sp. EUN1f TaxID=102897 RepID=UPI0001C46CE5|nr:hypothetical protein [Parafrankia sp. EUN1f]EFC80248.1 hypothetical protein FrEUN1fDRAFT_6642 [Parafrankia sp. EUN1f]
MDLPEFLLRFTAAIEPYQGAGAYGPVHGPAVTVRCFAEHRRTLTVDRESKRVTANTTVWFSLGTVCPAESMVTIFAADGSVMAPRARVLTSNRRDGGGLPTPDHLEITLQ